MGRMPPPRRLPRRLIRSRPSCIREVGKGDYPKRLTPAKATRDCLPLAARLSRQKPYPVRPDPGRAALPRRGCGKCKRFSDEVIDLASGEILDNPRDVTAQGRAEIAPSPGDRRGKSGDTCPIILVAGEERDRRPRLSRRGGPAPCAASRRDSTIYTTSNGGVCWNCLLDMGPLRRDEAAEHPISVHLCWACAELWAAAVREDRQECQDAYEQRGVEGRLRRLLGREP
jgi:hypothetical protein